MVCGRGTFDQTVTRVVGEDGQAQLTVGTVARERGVGSTGAVVSALCGIEGFSINLYLCLMFSFCPFLKAYFFLRIYRCTIEKFRS